jgi:hypothetical protein
VPGAFAATDTLLGIPPFEAKYNVGNYSVTAAATTITLKRDGQLWLYQSYSRAQGFFALIRKERATESSWLEVEKDALRPVIYRYRQTGSNKKRDAESLFDWKTLSVDTTRGEKKLHQKLTVGTYDRFSVVLALMQAARKGFQVIEFPINDQGKIKTLAYENEGTEKIRVPYGALETLRVREIRNSGKRNTVSWFAPGLNYLPIRIEQFRKGKLVARMELTQLSWHSSRPSS